MKEYKRIKDPIYGYIKIPVRYMTEIVDTSTFQRLRRIIQTSYSPLYSSAVHNRFVHSLGVFYLGDLTIKQLTKEISIKGGASFDLQKYGEVFKLACLLHDVGHAPFSHTGEDFFLGDKHNYDEIHQQLIKVIGSDAFRLDIPQDTSFAAAAHEIMSAIIGIMQFGKFMESVEHKEFFARCITGYKYTEASIDNSIKNCYISMLNSKIIDVDKLDYLIRDAYITGFDTVNIDFERLISSLTITRNGTTFQIAYYKNAISVIENVVYAHDAERKWIQSHPAVLYETYIIQHIIAHLSEHIDTKEKRLFSLESLSAIGQKFQENISISLLCDDDIIYLIKNVFPNDLGKEFFERKERRHPIWKSEAEYKAFILDLASGGSILNEFETAMSQTAKYLIKSTDSWVINDALISKLKKEIDELNRSFNGDEETRKVQLEDKTKILKVVLSLNKYSEEKKIDCNFVILMTSQFNSGFGKPDFSAINIVFETSKGEKVAKFGDIVSSLNAKEKNRDNFFYLFYKRKNDDIDHTDIDNQEICKRLFKDVVFQ